MIRVRGFADQRVAVFGLGRSGLTTARALEAGGAAPVLWDDSEKAREAARAEGFQVQDLRDAAEHHHDAQASPGPRSGEEHDHAGDDENLCELRLRPDGDDRKRPEDYP